MSDLGSVTTGELLAELETRMGHVFATVPGSVANLCRYLLSDAGMAPEELAERRTGLVRSTPPWTDDQVRSLNGYQHSGVFHPFTCGRCRDLDTEAELARAAEPGGPPFAIRDERLLVATTDGWMCPNAGCGYTQDWAWAFMADGDWRQTAELQRSLGFNVRT